MLHGGKAIKRQFWGAGIEFVAKALCTDDKKPGEGKTNAGHSHHVAGFCETFMSLCLEL